MKKRLVLAGAGVAAGALACGAAVALAGHGPEAAARPGQVRSIALGDLPGGTAARPLKGLARPKTEPFSLLGVTWDRPGAALAGTVQVRTRAQATGAWTAWRPVAAEAQDRPDGAEGAGTRGGTAGLWVGPSTGVDVRVAGSRALPAGLRVDLVDPGTPGRSRRGDRPVALAAATDAATPADPSEPPSETPAEDPSGTPSATPSETSTGTATLSPEASAAPEPSGTPPASAAPSAPAAAEPAPTAYPTVGTAPRPAIVARAAWGADESIVKAPPTYDTDVKAVFVHHSDTGNAYTCAESAAVVRSIMLYHVRTEGWDDLGYNFLVDKCGTVFEGRAGGTERAVHGAHTYGFNTDTTGIAVLGTYTAADDKDTPGVAPAQAALDAVAKVAAWKLGLTGRDPGGKVTLTSAAPDGTGGKYPFGTPVSFDEIAGHRDGYATACPGVQLYGKLPAIRAIAQQWSSPATGIALASLGGAAKSGGTYYTRGTVTPSWKPGPFASVQVRVDGAAKATVTSAATSAPVTLAPGAHTLALRAVTLDGKTLDSPSYPVYGDATAPKFGSPAALWLRTGTVSTTYVPLALGWKVTDDRALKSVVATAPSSASFALTATRWNAGARPGARTWTLAATDVAGNRATSSVTRTAALVAETSATRTGTWKTSTTSSYLGGRGLYSSAKGASATWRFTGRSAGLIVKRASNVGAVYVYVDGRKVATLDTRAAKTAYRQLAYTRTWSSSAAHTIKIVVAGTAKRPTVGIDGIAYVR
ncbi:peptidoglycan recognition protein family protein [Actinomadura parmotrematis]|uniref:Peptidoglycan recognition protein n=1 Tax=Actinomadura parmotrematis TaxID=2864039 RepID=A0ABS7FV46_9ACTN|nr:peptidoglycan recognition protein [Actinomadura parmotrematis]MBW8484295.1 peptidoglycan recognition protein [Actinomadura parmotrematis]